MLKACASIVEKSGKSLGKVWRLCASSTGGPKYLTSQVFFVPKFYKFFEQDMGTFEQPGSSIFNLLGTNLYPLSTLPIDTTKLIKE